ncbi:MAG: hypothetical protein N4A57_12295 [Anaeromicrobium sp.]|jgi:hypothetical protein|uniref:hypothetical protein n=1 Tax=Anaeromicrobium sp. TaxID=1929132 RepID=UPI0025DA3F4A|nr:hypothetical protein [Anaeromicrobium sp.]MCT4595032.1 hypothetical protein [Anaeromicrobium sp.]
MNSVYKNQYIYFSKTNFIYFFYKKDKDLYLDIIKDDQVYMSKKLVKNIIDYSIGIDSNEKFHIVVISSLGELKYTTYENGYYEFKSIAKYDHNSNNLANLKIFIINEEIHILLGICNILNSELWTLKHHYYKIHKWYTRKICNIVTEKYNNPFNVDVDYHNNIHIVFKSLYNRKYFIYYCKFNPSYDLWTHPTRILNTFNIHTTPFILCDNLNKGHMVWSKLENNNLGIYYTCNENLNSSKGTWAKAQKISRESTNNTNPIIIKISNFIKVLWNENGQFISKSRSVLTDLWNDEFENMGYDYEELVPSTLLGNNYINYELLKIPFTYAILKNRLYILGINLIDYNKKENTPPQIVPLDEPIPNSIKQESFNDLNNFLLLMEDMKKKQENINNLLNLLTKRQELTKEKIEFLTNQCNMLNENLKNDNKNFFSKLLSLFK